MVLFLFVIMLLNLGAPHALRETGRLQIVPALILAAVFAVVLYFSGALFNLPPSISTQAEIDAMGTVQNVGLNLYDPKQPWLFPFELTSILLLVAVVGAIIMAKRRI